jgi:hypothetical protein
VVIFEVFSTDATCETPDFAEWEDAHDQGDTTTIPPRVERYLAVQHVRCDGVAALCNRMTDRTVFLVAPVSSAPAIL